MTTAWFSPLFHLSSGGGMLVALPYEQLGDWNVSDDDYEELAAKCEQSFLLHGVGRGHGLVVGSDEGLNEAHWVRLEGQTGVTMVAWSEWADPNRVALAANLKQTARNWDRGDDPRQRWLVERLTRDDLQWVRLAPTQNIPSGVLLLTFAEGRPAKSRLAKPRTAAETGQIVPVGLPSGAYRIETAIVDELPHGAHLAYFARWTPTP